MTGDGPPRTRPQNPDAVTSPYLSADGNGLTTESVSFSPLVELVGARWRLLVLSTVLGLTAGIAVSFLMPRQYEAHVLVAPVSEDQSASSLSLLASRLAPLAGVAGISLGTGDISKQALIATLTSRRFVDAFVSEYQVDKEVFARQWDSQRKSWRPNRRGKIPSAQDTYEFVTRQVLSVNDDKRTGLVTVVVRWRDRNKTALWANALVVMLNQTARALVMQETKESIQYLTEELTKTDIVDLRQSMFSVMQTQLNRRMLATVRPEYAFRVIDPAIVPDVDKYVAPLRLLFAAAGAGAGALLALGVAKQTQRRRSSARNI
jgi:uncharacterized protein involved in exopolysaccharide biosynthesis